MTYCLWDYSNPLHDLRVCLNGTFSIETNKLKKMILSAGAKIVDVVSLTRNYKESDAMPPVREDTNIYVVGNNPNEESLKRYERNVHDGFKAVKIDETQLMQLIDGTSDLEIPKKITKCLDLTIDYYNWQPPIINEKIDVLRLSSPLKYDMTGKENCIYQKEIFVPDFPNINMLAFRQLVGNFGGYANNSFYDDTDIIMLGNETLEYLRKGIKDDTIRQIEENYNSSDSKFFNVVFTSEADFLEWATAYISINGDEVSKRLLERL
ncbi:MAG: BRCT domain-containing protein [Muribaculaceae bacterium]|nr:BRCT domain-containing protein [Muribaculaceae bacterium]